jgi:signal transduction histidine kinase
MFYRATDKGAGSGLGLYIVKETIDKLHGSINIESEEGKGTKIKMVVPELQ